MSRMWGFRYVHPVRRRHTPPAAAAADDDDNDDDTVADVVGAL